MFSIPATHQLRCVPSQTCFAETSSSLNIRTDKPSKCTSWFNTFNPDEQKEILEKLNSSNKDGRGRFIRECVTLDDTIESKGISNKFQMCHPINIMVSCRRAEFAP